jgi:hypothetical protein
MTIVRRASLLGEPLSLHRAVDQFAQEVHTRAGA